MPPLLEDPRIRQNWNTFSSTAESAAENAAASIWSFTHSYIRPCLASLGHATRTCTGACLASERRQRERGRSHGRLERSFDFYDDWDDDIQNSSGAGGGGGILGWGNDELDRLLTGSAAYGDDGTTQPGRRRGISYGTRGGGGRPKRKGTLDGLPDPTIIPSTSALGFLGRLPFKLGKTLRYTPSAADLKEHPAASKRHIDTAQQKIDAEEGEPLIAHDDDVMTRQTRKRSSTTGSGDTSDSFRSRGDLFPSDDEDDAILLDDEFAMVLERRTINSTSDDRSSNRTKSSKGKRPAGAPADLSRTQSVHTQASARASTKRSRRSSLSDVDVSMMMTGPDMASLTDLRHEEDRVRSEEEEAIERRRHAAQALARRRGLASSSGEVADEVKEERSELHAHETLDFPPALADTQGRGDPGETMSLRFSSPHVSAEDESDRRSPEKMEPSFVPARLPHF